ncbi:MAG TPA: hypothetical protein VFE05_22540 [Longimicrobiaceae bacterium]|jgi:hypothetical protein|nr:hypothetical protein [Longimicrobiaceae bacterium]
MNRPLAGLGLLAALGAASGAAAQAAGPAARFDVVGRGPVTNTRTTDLAVFRAPNGRDYAYTGTFGDCQRCSGNRMFVFDVTDPAHPVRTDSVVVDAKIVNDVAVNREGTLAVLTREGATSRRNGLVILDLADPAHPRQTAEFWETITGGAHNVFLDGKLAYVVDAGTWDLVVVDLSDLRDPVQVGRWSLETSTMRLLQDVYVKDGLAYLSAWDDGLVILDVGQGIKKGTPQHPQMVSQFRYRTRWHGEQYGHTHFAYPYTNAAGHAYVFVGDVIIPRGVDLNKRFDSGGSIHVLDVSRLTAPLEVASYAVEGAGVDHFWIENDVLYTAALTAGVHAADVSGDLRGTLRGREIASFSTADPHGFVPNLAMAWAVRPHNGLLFATDFNSGLWIARLTR